MKKLLALLVALSMLLAMLPAALAEDVLIEEPVPEETTVALSNDGEVFTTKITVTPKSVKDLGVDKSVTLTARRSPDNATGDVSWEVTKGQDVVSLEVIDGQAYVVGKKAGKAVVTASAPGKKKPVTAKVNITVKDNSVATGIKVDKKKLALDLAKPEGEALKTTLTPAGANVSRIRWSVSPAEGVVELSETEGDQTRATPVGLGKATITASVPAAKGTKSVKISVTVADQSAPTGVKLSGDKAVDISGELHVTATLQPAGAKADEDTVEWEYDDKFLTLTNEALGDGAVTATFQPLMDCKSTTITAKVQTAKGVKKATHKVKIEDKSAPTGIKVDIKKITKDLADDDPSFTLTAELLPQGAKGEIDWSVDETYLTIMDEQTDPETGISTIELQPQKIAKSTKVTASAMIGGKTKTATATVTIKDSSAPTGIKLDKTKLTLDMAADGESGTVTATLTPDKSRGEIQWAITKGQGVVSFEESAGDEHSSTITIFPEKVGAAEITASVKGLNKSQKVSITVKDDSAPTGIEFTDKKYKNVTLDMGKEEEFADVTVVLKPDNARAEIQWEIMKGGDVVEFEETDGDGHSSTIRIYPRHPGEAEIRATVPGLNKWQTVKVKVEDNEPEDGDFGDVPTKLTITGLEETTIDMRDCEGELWLDKEMEPMESADLRATWSSSDNSIAEVRRADGDEDTQWEGGAYVILKKAGKVTITATSVKKNTVKDSITLTITDKYAPDSIEFDAPPSNMTVGQDWYPSVTLTRSDGEEPWTRLTYKSSDSSVLKQDPEEEGRFIAQKSGEATVTVTTHNGKTASCKIRVQAVGLSIGSYKLYYGSSFSLADYVTYADDSARAASQPLTWISSNPAVATVDAAGTVQAVAQGETTITMRTATGLTADCAVTVLSSYAPVSMRFEPVSDEIAVGDTVDLNEFVTFLDKDGNPTDETTRLAWELKERGKKTARISTGGILEALGPGEIKVSITAKEIHLILAYEFFIV